MTAKIFRVLGVNLLVLFGCLLLIEAIAQAVALLRPSYDVLFLQPDRVTGWKQVPNLRWTWAGNYWYAVDYRVNVTTNPLGFRDLAREVNKPAGVKRVAVLGDSFIEAVQVPLEKTATQLLERRLNTDATPATTAPRWEVLNFGISNYGVGQYLLAWEKYARPYQPDYVAIFVARFHMQRSIRKYESGAFSATTAEKLWIRPTFHLEQDVLIREAARDYDTFVKTQQQLQQTAFAGNRSRTKRPQLFSLFYTQQLWQELKPSGHTEDKIPKQETATYDKGSITEQEMLATNLKIIETLGQQVGNAGGKLIVIDVTQYFGDDPTLSQNLAELCDQNDFAYIPLYEDLLQANANGIRTRWSHDGHFNEQGNILLAEALYQSLNITRDARLQSDSFLPLARPDKSRLTNR